MKTLALILMIISTNAQAAGTITFAELRPLLAQKPQLTKARLAGITVEKIGTAVRIGRTVSPALGGTRICPYFFQGRDRRHTLVDITIIADVDFYDAAGRLACHLEACKLDCPLEDMKTAVSYKETLRDILVQKPKRP